ncbi:MAG: DUF4249 domain-containing protein [Chitinophagaceae bacterium]|nr:MAG: DUF4249 domain-containing protein [Chitinophagaceae bacterium]
MKFVIGCIVSILFLSSCEKDINFDLDEVEPVLSVDAQIENDRPPVVVLTRSFSYFDKLSPELLSNAFVRDAEVYVRNGTRTQRLKEYSYPLAPGISGYYYTADSTNLANAFTGALGGSYELKILNAGQEYSARTTIPAASQFPDSVWFIRAPQNPDTTLRAMYIRASDPPGRGNYYRYFTQASRGEFLPGENVFDDQVIDGTTYNIMLPRGVNRNRPMSMDDNFYLKGEIVTLKYCSIDAASYKFWNTWEFAFQSIGNPFAQPNKVLGNISNGALGIFCGYAAEYRTYILP